MMSACLWKPFLLLSSLLRHCSGDLWDISREKQKRPPGRLTSTSGTLCQQQTSIPRGLSSVLCAARTENLSSSCSCLFAQSQKTEFLPHLVKIRSKFYLKDRALSTKTFLFFQETKLKNSIKTPGSCVGVFIVGFVIVSLLLGDAGKGHNRNYDKRVRRTI